MPAVSAAQPPPKLPRRSGGIGPSPLSRSDSVSQDHDSAAAPFAAASAPAPAHAVSSGKGLKALKTLRIDVAPAGSFGVPVLGGAVPLAPGLTSAASLKQARSPPGLPLISAACPADLVSL